MDYHLWADFETTDLEPAMDTILEAAWTITDSELRMVTPLRSRLCLIDPPDRRRDANLHLEHPLRNLTKFRVGDGTDEKPGHWSILPDVVQDMHEKSGLRDELVGAVTDPVASLGVLTTAIDLGRLIKEDVLSVNFNRDTDRLILSGAGVSHFDNRVFDLHLPGMFPLRGGGVLSYSYWQHDTSVARRVIGEAAWNEIYRTARELPPGHPVFQCEAATSLNEGYAPVHVEFARTGDHVDAGNVLVFMRDQLTVRRAADDVVQALVDGRVLRAATGWSAK